MPATNQNFSMHAGDAKALEFTVTDDAGAVVDLTGMSALWLLSRHPSDAAPLLSKDVTIAEALAAADEFLRLARSKQPVPTFFVKPV